MENELYVFDRRRAILFVSTCFEKDSKRLFGCKRSKKLKSRDLVNSAKLYAFDKGIIKCISCSIQRGLFPDTFFESNKSR